MKFELLCSGTAPLLMHNARLANPLDEFARKMKDVTKKKQKTDTDLLELARLEFLGSLYFDPTAGPYVPAANILRSLLDAAKKSRSGPKVKEGVWILGNINPLAYQGPRTVDALWADESFRHFASARVGMQRVQRCRPVFHDWSVVFDGELDPEIISVDELRGITETAGYRLGLGDWRPTFGRFEAQLTLM